MVTLGPFVKSWVRTFLGFDLVGENRSFSSFSLGRVLRCGFMMAIYNYMTLSSENEREKRVGMKKFRDSGLVGMDPPVGFSFRRCDSEHRFVKRTAFKGAIRSWSLSQSCR